ncbi:MAG: penicillin acylase family protein, partial [Bacteroidetes bacterium]|nr:penicillin acylase family protein [Bacteroidota bacterium]
EPIINKILVHYGPEYLQDFDMHHYPGTAQIPVHIPETASLPSMAAEVAQILENLPTPLWIGSNSWVVAPERSQSGKVLFANDPHIGFGQPSVWYEAHLETPEFSLYGNHLAGYPFAPIGHTRSHAIGLTMLENDDMQFYREKLNPENANQVWVDDHWEEMEIREKTIQIKDQKDTTIQVKITRHGPIVNEVFESFDTEENAPVSMHWIYTKFLSHQLHVSYEMSHAKSMEEVEAAVSQLEGPGLNVMYGDTAGNIAWWGAGKLIHLPDHVNSKFILDGASGKDEPLGYFDFSENPKSINPPSGYVYSANNQPGPVNGYLHPGYYAPGDRGQRVMEILSQKEIWNKEEMQKMALDNTSPTYPGYLEHIIPLVDFSSMNNPEKAEKILALLKGWDGNHDLTSVAPTIFYKWINRIMYKTLGDEIGMADYTAFSGTFMVKRSTPLILANDSSVWWDDVSTDDQTETRSMIVNQAFSETITDLDQLLGKDYTQWTWNRAHTIEHGHPIGRQEPFDKLFNVGPLPIAGGHEVINNTAFSQRPGGLYKVAHGPSRRAVIDFADLEHGQTILPTGQSGNPMSPHYDDQAEMYAKGEYRTMLFNRKEIEAAATYRLNLSPQ